MCAFQSVWLAADRYVGRENHIYESPLLAIHIKIHIKIWFHEKKNSIIFTEAVLWDTWIHPNVPVESILLASLTVSPQISNTGLVAPITPQTRGPTLMPVTKNPNDFEHNVTLASIIGPDHLESALFRNKRLALNLMP